MGPLLFNILGEEKLLGFTGKVLEILGIRGFLPENGVEVYEIKF